MAASDDVLQRFFGSSTTGHVVAHVLREVHQGRDLASTLDDAYVTNRMSPRETRQLLDHPEIIHAVSDDVLASLRSRLT